MRMLAMAAGTGMILAILAVATFLPTATTPGYAAFGNGSVVLNNAVACAASTAPCSYAVIDPDGIAAVAIHEVTGGVVEGAENTVVVNCVDEAAKIQTAHNGAGNPHLVRYADCKGNFEEWDIAADGSVGARRPERPPQTPVPTPDKKITIRLSFLSVGAAPWTATNVKGQLDHVNAIWGQANINFTWPNNPTLHPITDPQFPRFGGPPAENDGDIVDWFKDPKSEQEREATLLCKSAIAKRDMEKPGSFPVALAWYFTDAAGARQPGNWGVTFSKDLVRSLGNDGPQGAHGACVIISYENKDPGEPKPGETLAHELGHVLCLPHVDDPHNLMHAKAITANKLTEQQITKAQACGQELIGQLGGGGPVGGIVDEVPDSVSDQLEPSGSSGASAGVLAGVVAGAVVVGVVTLGGGAWYLRRRRVG